MKKLKFIIYTPAFIWLAYYIIRLYSLTFRLTVVNEGPWKKRLGNGQAIIMCTWHQQFFAAIRHFKTYSHLNPGLMISQSRDGDLISGVANQTGWHTPRGSLFPGGRAALDAMIAHVREHKLGAHILDGPRGPIGKIKPGIIKMAMETGAAIVPFYTRADKAWYFNSWDRFMLPKPFSRVELIFDDPIELSHDVCSDDFARLRQKLEAQMTPGLHL